MRDPQRYLWSTVLTIIFIVGSGVFLHVADAAYTTDGLVGYWKFDETSAGSFFNASGETNTGAGNGATGANNTPQPNADVPSVNFPDTRSLDFDGTDDYVSVSNPFTADNFTISVWVNPDVINTGSYQGFMGRQDDGGWTYRAPGLWVGPENSALHYDSYNTAGTRFTNEITGFFDGGNQWVHIAWVKNGAEFDIYKNGSIIADGDPAPGTLYRGGSDYEFGRVDNYFNGKLDDIRIYSRALSSTEIGQLAAGDHTSAVWDGSSSTNFETAANWNINAVPDPYTNLIIPDTANTPYLTAAVSGASLRIDSGASLDLAGYDFALTDSGSLTGGGTLRLIGSETITNMVNTSTGTVMYYGTGSYTGLAAGNTYYDLLINDALVGYWNFDVTGSIVEDVSGYDADGSREAGVQFTATVAPTSFTNPNAMTFDGIDDYIDVESGFADFSEGVTIALWARPTNNASWSRFIDFGNGVADENILFGRASTSTNLFFDVYDGSSASIVIGTGALVNDEWHHYAATLTSDGNTLLYRDGDVVGAGATNVPNNVVRVNNYIGRSNWAIDDYYQGQMDDVRIYDRPLSQLEIAALAAGNMPAAASGTFTLGADLAVANDLKIVSGDLDVSGSEYGITLSGSWLNYGGQFSPQEGTVTFDGTSGTETLLSGGQSFANLTGAGAATWELHDLLDIDGTLALNGATLDVTTANYDVHAADIDQTGGTFTTRSGTVTLDSDSSQTSTFTSTINKLNIEDPTENGLVGYWKFDEGQGSTLFDSSSVGTNGTRNGTGAVWTGSVLPTLGFVNQSAMQFNGVSDYMSVANTPFTESSDEGSISMWVRPDSTSASQVFFWTEANRDRGMATDGDDSVFAAIMYDGTFGNFRHLSGGTITGNWQHVVFSWDINEGQLRLYVDGALADSFDGPGWTDAAVASPSVIGRYGGDSDNSYNSFNPFYAGLMDDVRVYNRALSPTEVANLANGYYADGDNATATVTLGGNLDVEDINIFSGKLGGSTRTIDVSGDWNNYAGTGSFVAGTSTVDLDGASTQNVRGSSNFYNFEISTASAQTVKFGSGSTQGISNLLTLTGQSSNILTLAPLSSGYAWNLDVNSAATQSISYVSPSYSDASPGAAILATDGTSINGGNNVNWQFPVSVEFQSGSTTYSETDGSASVTISLSGTTLVDITIPFTVTGTASNGSDYTLINSSPVIINAGESSTGVTITFTDDSDSESDETIILTIGTPTNADKGSTTVHTLTLTSDDAAPSSSSSSSSSSISSTSSTSGSGGGGGGGGGHRGSAGPGGPSNSPLAQQAREEILARFYERIRQGSIFLTQQSSSSQHSSARSTLVRRVPEQTEEDHAAAPDPVPTFAKRVTEKRGLLSIETPQDEVIYKDVPVLAWYAPYVSMLIEEEIADGYRTEAGELTGEFGVENPVTYAELAKMVLQAANIPLSTKSTRNASANGSWASSYIRTAEEHQFSVYDTSLDVHKPATRGEVIQTILEALNIPIGTRPGEYDDLPENHPHAQAIGTATYYGLIEGDTDANGKPLGTVRPDDQVNRAEAAKLVALARELVQ